MDTTNKKSSKDPFDLNRFVEAQKTMYERALSEVKAGKKQSHWMWYIFPQLDGLGFSDKAKFYGIKSIEEAQGYLNHLVLGDRLRECAQAAEAITGSSATEIFGWPDDKKFKSCATLFAALPETDPVFDRLLTKYFQGERDGKTLQLLGKK